MLRVEIDMLVSILNYHWILKSQKQTGNYFVWAGDKAWKHGLRSTFKRGDGTNTIVVGSGEVPTMGVDHYKDFTTQK